MKKVKVIIDVLMFVITFSLMSINVTGRTLHEVLGISLTLLLVLHIVFNFKWIRQVTLNFSKVKFQTKLVYVVNVLIFALYFLTIVLGIITSFSIISLDGVTLIRLTLFHNIFGRFSTVFMLIHVGFHLKLIISKFIRNDTFKMVIYIVYVMFVLIVTLYLLYTLSQTYLWMSFMW